MSGPAWLHPWSLTAAALVGTLAAATVARSYAPPDVRGDDRYPFSWLITGPSISQGEVARFRRSADPGERAAVARIVVEEASAASLPPQFVAAVARVESGMRPAHLVTGPPTRYGRAVGTMQVLPSTARSIGCGNLRNTRENIRCGVRYLRMGVERCGGDLECAARFYHGGPNTRIHGRVTHGYGRRVVGLAGARYARPASGLGQRFASSDDRYFREWFLNR